MVSSYAPLAVIAMEWRDCSYGPNYVCVSGHYVYVTNYSGHYVSVFTTAGDYVTSFGQRGSGEGGFNTPCGVCTDKDGFVYVADCFNHRVQCF